MTRFTAAGALLLLSTMMTACLSGGGGATDHGPTCDAGELASALASAGQNDTVRVGACRVTGSFSVPAGVHLVGAGRGTSTIVAAAGAGVSATAGSISDLSVESDGVAAIVASGAGDVVIERVDVSATHGIGIGVEDATTLHVTDVTLSGPVKDAAGAAALPPVVSAKDTATHGLVLVHVGAATLANVTISGFGDYGALFVQTTADWQGGASSGNLGNGLVVDGGKVTLGNVSLCGTLGGKRTLPPYGAVLTNTDATTKGITVCDNKGIGLLQVGGTSAHTDLNATGNAGPALWAQGATSVSIAGKSVISKNGYAGLVAIETKAVGVSGAKIDENVLAQKPIGSSGADQLGDGVQLVHSPFGIVFENVTLTNNARAGIQLQLGTVDQEAAGLTWKNVVVTSTGAEYGALCQGNAEVWGPTDKWSTGIVRMGAALVNDATVKDMRVTAAGIIGPPYIPAAGAVTIGGLTAP